MPIRTHVVHARTPRHARKRTRPLHIGQKCAGRTRGGDEVQGTGSQCVPGPHIVQVFSVDHCC
jgi:hypothetical protein